MRHRCPLLLVPLLAVALSAQDRGDPQAELAAAPTVLAAARAAMGGDAALGAVKAFSITGRRSTDLGVRQLESRVQISCQLPDRYASERTQTNDAPFGSFDVVQRDGFAADALIRDTSFRNSPFGQPPEPPGSQPRTAAEQAERTRKGVLRQQQILNRLTLALFASSVTSYPLEFTSAGRVQLEGGITADAIDAKGPDGFVFRLFVDVTRHLPVMMSWREPPMVIAQVSSVVATTTTTTIVTVPAGGRGGVPPMFPPSLPPAPPPPPPITKAPPGGVLYSGGMPAGDPTAGLPLVEHQLWFSDYRAADGLMWPHRLVEKVDGQVLEDTKVARFKLNPKFGASVFKPAK